MVNEAGLMCHEQTKGLLSSTGILASHIFGQIVYLLATINPILIMDGSIILLTGDQTRVTELKSCH